VRQSGMRMQGTGAFDDLSEALRRDREDALDVFKRIVAPETALHGDNHPIGRFYRKLFTESWNREAEPAEILRALSKATRFWTDQFELFEKSAAGPAIGSGAMAKVFPSRYFGRTVAMKTLSPKWMDRAHIDRFFWEASTHGTLPSESRGIPEFVAVFGHSALRLKNGTPFYLMELVEAPTLSTVLRKVPLDRESRLRLAQAVGVQTGTFLQSLEGLHRVHRDVKPENILVHGLTVDQTGRLLHPENLRIVLIDFGLVGSIAGNNSFSKDLVGTPYFMPFWLWHGLPLSHRDDLHALTLSVFDVLQPPGTPSLFSEPENTPQSFQKTLSEKIALTPPKIQRFLASIGLSDPQGSLSAWAWLGLNPNPIAPYSASQFVERLNDAWNSIGLESVSWPTRQTDPEAKTVPDNGHAPTDPYPERWAQSTPSTGRLQSVSA
jgi:serine/threonine protein kinase